MKMCKDCRFSFQPETYVKLYCNHAVVNASDYYYVSHPNPVGSECMSERMNKVRESPCNISGNLWKAKDKPE